MSKKTQRIIWIIISIVTIISLIVFPIVALVEQSKQAAPTTNSK